MNTCLAVCSCVGAILYKGKMMTEFNNSELFKLSIEVRHSLVVNLMLNSSSPSPKREIALNCDHQLLVNFLVRGMPNATIRILFTNVIKYFERSK